MQRNATVVSCLITPARIACGWRDSLKLAYECGVTLKLAYLRSVADHPRVSCDDGRSHITLGRTSPYDKYTGWPTHIVMNCRGYE
jgi:hypothetical protein